jgi:hypothetical protein
MIALDEDALICDMAETYHIYEMRKFPLRYIATLANGLRDNSRIKMKASGLEADINRLLLAHIADNCAINVWTKTEDGQKGINQPKSFVKALTEKIDDSKTAKGFISGADFDAAWREINGR